MLRYLARKRAFFFGVLIFTATGTRNYGDKLIEQIWNKQPVSEPTLILFVIYLAITCFILGYFLALEINVKEPPAKKPKS